MPARSNNFDLIRLLAALQVVIGHAVDFFDVDLPAVIEPLYVLIRWFPGVPVFFVLSGYLLAKSLDRDGNLARYARNRALRMFPALWVCVGVTAVLLAAAGLLLDLSPLKLMVFLVAQATVGQSWIPFPITEYGLGSPLTPNPALWTIRVEIGFYILLPILVLGGRAVFRSARWLDAFLVSVAAASFGTYLFWGETNLDDSGYTLPLRLLVNSPAPFLWMFCVGILFHRHDATVRRAFSGRVLGWTALFLAVRAVVYLVFEAGDAAPGAPLAALGVANLLLVAPTFALGFSRSPHVGRLDPPLDISYGIYVWHLVLLNAMIHWGLASGWAGAGLTFSGAIAAGYLSCRFVETPALARKAGSRSGQPVTSGASRRLIGWRL